MKKFSLALLMALSSSPVLAQEISVRAKVIGSESALSADSKNISSTESSDDDENNNAFGYGADVEFMLNEQFRLGTGLAYTDYEADKDKIGYSDVTWSGYGSLDFLRDELLSLYGTAGISYHNLTLDDRDFGGISVDYDSTGLLNYDLAIGGRAKLNEGLTFGLEYKFTDTFSTNDVDGRVEGLGLVSSTDTVLEDVTIRKNELVASLGYAF